MGLWETAGCAAKGGAVAAAGGAVAGTTATVGGYGFLTPQPLWVGQGAGFVPFSHDHLSWLGFCALLVLWLAHAYRRLPQGLGWGSARRRTLLLCAAVPLALCAVHDALMAAAGAFAVEWWPLHLCNMCELLCLVFALRPNDFTGEVLAGLGIPASVLALAFPGWTVAPAWSLPSVCGFVEHALVLAFVAMVVLGRDAHVEVARTWEPLAVLGAYVAFVYPFNQSYGTNFAFLAQAIPHTPLALWETSYGSPGYLAPYAVAFSLCVWGSVWLCSKASRT